MQGCLASPGSLSHALRHFASKGGAKATSAASKKAAAAAAAAAATPVAAGSGDLPRPSGPRDPRWELARLRNPKADTMELLTEEQATLLKKLAETTLPEGGPEGGECPGHISVPFIALRARLMSRPCTVCTVCTVRRIISLPVRLNCPNGCCCCSGCCDGRGRPAPWPQVPGPAVE